MINKLIIIEGFWGLGKTTLINELHDTFNHQIIHEPNHLLGDPRRKEMSEKVNNIKNRELWRPFAPSIISEYTQEFFEEDIESPYMLYTFKVKDKYKKIIPAVCHVDGTSRAQTVTKHSNKLFWGLLNEFKIITGIPLVLNTSFNGPGEPIVSSPEDALKMFLRTKLDTLIIGNYIVKKYE